MANSHATQGIGFIVIVVIAMATARGLKRALLTLVTIAAFSGAGFGLGYVLGSRGTTAANNAISGMLLLGALSAVFCMIRNRSDRGHRPPFTSTSQR